LLSPHLPARFAGAADLPFRGLEATPELTSLNPCYIALAGFASAFISERSLEKYRESLVASRNLRYEVQSARHSAS
jgi:hypothetical protein